MHLTNLISAAVGSAAHRRLPGVLAQWSVKAFARMYHLDLESAAKPLHAYRSIGELFVRDLKPGVRPIGGGVVSPVDGVLRGSGMVAEGAIAVKGSPYRLAELLGSEERAAPFVDGCYLNFYLSPRDYHHVHAPLAGRVRACTRIPGSLWPVNDWSLQHISQLFVKNARSVLYCQSPVGLVAVVMVGALNVGSIELRYDVAQGPEGARRAVIHEEFLDENQIEQGDRLGGFRLGSSVVLLFEPGRVQPVLPAGSRVLFGQTVAEVR